MLSSTQTCLNKRWLSKPLKNTIDMAIKQQPAVTSMLAVEVDGQDVDITQPASKFMRDDGTPVKVVVHVE